MGADPYFYAVDYQDDIRAALDGLRQREFEARRYRPVVDRPQDYFVSPTEMKGGPGAQHDSIEAVFEEAAAEGDPDGTASILDLWTIGDQPQLMTASRLTGRQLDRYFGTIQPTVEQINGSDECWEDIDRGTGRYVIAYHEGRPSHICFAGYSFD